MTIYGAVMNINKWVIPIYTSVWPQKAHYLYNGRERCQSIKGS